MLNRTIPQFLAAAALVFASLTPLQAAAVPDFAAGPTPVVQPDGAFTANKYVRIYLEGNPEDPFPGDGFNTYIYVIENDLSSLFPIIRFAIQVPPLAVTGAGAIAGPDIAPDAPGGAVVGNEVEWNYFSGGIPPGQKTQEMYILSPFTPGGTTDNIVSINGEFGFDAPTACIGPMIPPSEECELTVDKYCFVEPPPPSSGNDCQGKVVKMVYEYTGSACNPAANDQGSEATCSGDPAGAQPVEVVVTQDASMMTVLPAGQTVGIGSMVNFTATGAYLPNNVYFQIKKDGSTLQTQKIHTSCSKPLNVGDEFGAFKLVEITSTQGGTHALPDPNPDPTDVCVIQAFPAGTPCQQKPSTINLRYVGGDCTATTNNQLGTVECAGDAGTTTPVRVTLSENADGSGHVFLDTVTATVALGAVVEATAANAGVSEFDASVYVRIRDAGGATLQLLKIRTDCYKPLAIGDRFGAVQVVGLDNMSMGDNVTYTYVVTNPNSGTATNVNVIDVPLGIITAGETIAGNSSETYTRDEFITVDTVNTVTVTGEVNSTVCDEGVDGASVTVEPQQVISKKKKHKHKKKVSKHKGHHAKKKQHQHRHGCGHHGW
jgi:uncharacterized repeat protein (TIGR01451 family)